MARFAPPAAGPFLLRFKSILGFTCENLKKAGCAEMTGPVNKTFKDASEGEDGWQIRYGAEPIDLHLFKKLGRDDIDKSIERQGMTAGIGSVFNHNYIEILNPSGRGGEARAWHGSRA
jgi:hypothetical protein